MSRRTVTEPPTHDSDHGLGSDREEHIHSPDRFIVPSRDELGHSDKVTFSCSPFMQRALAVVLSTRLFPYQTVGDIIRHGVLRHLRWLHKVEPEMPQHFLSVMEAAADMVRDDDMVARGQQVIETLRKKIEEEIAAGENDAAIQKVQWVKVYVRMLPDSKWKERFQRQFIEAFSKYME